MSTQTEAMKLALEALDVLLTEPIAHKAADRAEYLLLQAAPAIRKALAEEPAQRTWVWLSEEEKQEWIDAMPYDIEPRHCMILLNVMEVQLKQRNT